MNEGHGISPVNPLPPVVWLMALPVAAMEAVFALGRAGFGGREAVGWRMEALERFGFAPQLLQRMLESGAWPADHLMRFLTYPFVHGNFTHALFVCVFILALGKMVGEVFRPWAVLAVFFAAAVTGAAAYAALPQARMVLFGGYPAVYGLIGAFTFILWARLGAVNANRYRAFTLIGFLLFIQLVFGLIFGAGWDWVAEIAGFAAGFGLSFVVAPGGVGRIVARLRQR